MYNGAELAGATGARAPVLFLPRPEILGHILYVLSRFSGQIPEIPRPRPVAHLHYLGHFGASENDSRHCLDYQGSSLHLYTPCPCIYR